VSPATLLDRVWEEHRIATDADGVDLLHVDRSLLHDLSGTVGLEDLEAAGRRVRHPELHLAVPDHAIGSDPHGLSGPRTRRFVDGLARLTAAAGIRHLPRGSGAQGITHVVGLEQAFTLPGVTVVCGDSHTSTHGAVGALAWGIGSTETAHVLATQTLWQRKPRQKRVLLTGAPGPGVTAKDVVLQLIGRLGTDYGREHAVEFAGPYVRGLSVEGRATVCNLALELGARFALVAPDETVLRYLAGRPGTPTGPDLDAAVAHWRGLVTDPGAVFDGQVEVDVTATAPQVTWGTSPEHVVDVDGAVPRDADPEALAHQGLRPGQGLAGLPLDRVFIGSCANNRIEDLRAAARVLAGRRVADGLVAWVVPGSEAVAAAARAEGLEEVFTAAGFEWRAPGCSLCVAVNGDRVAPGQRCLSTSNRNFVGRQGPGARTHLASPVTAAASALAGCITDPRPLLEEGAP
jgi:3-isopropylmalate/(R)-2-methylmalate dehydratase large subunit